MANLVNLENVSKSFGLKTLLANVSLGVQTGDRIGVVGLNGGGKSTLLKVLAGIETPDEGRVSHVNGLRMAMITQSADLDPEATVAGIVLGPLGVETYQWASNPNIREVLYGLGIIDLGLDTRVGELSGGERRRANLAAALVQELDILILDEPTNHLDIEGVQWLADYLVAQKAALIVVTHDRWFLDTVATRTWEVHDGQVDTYEGGYNDWTFARAERARQADAMEQRRQNLARKELAWLRRGAPARTSKPRYRIEAAEALIANVPAPRDTVELMAFSKRRQGKLVIELEDASMQTPDGRDLLHNTTWRLAPGERIGLVGVNGSGKTTLLKTLAGEHPLTAGRRIQGKTVALGWLRQELDDLDPTMRLLDAVESVANYVHFGKKELTASQLAERLGFSAKRQRTPIRDLSGGERRRLQLTRVLMAEPNVLLLDEPTNDLDIDTLQELESLLDNWPGTLVVISHDRYLIERICDSTWALFGDGKLTNLPGGIDEYLQRRKTMPKETRPLNASKSGVPGGSAVGGSTVGGSAVGGSTVGGSTVGGSTVGGGLGNSGSTAEFGTGSTAGRSSGNAAGRSSGNAAGPDAATRRRLEKEMKALERKMEKLRDQLADIDQRMAASATDIQALTELSTESSLIREDIEAYELQWMELGEQLEG
ncbi:ABC-F family ATP-binding cassette domain-containing protein [Corynebacterium freiburgense]|uniref:ABC-F family ATP-binding cassette domain-containing protein n=1 Tax=Corynebacterium freiburgense TaxID=556548 RepID=UPI0004095359|nr:ABC-F family ATP-binding cassette domain-containing protein [Corynebacterium freiburgense]WJZ02130.1 putative ABC transporter ATP-binding protein [Corynebacterium freiburgense]